MKKIKEPKYIHQHPQVVVLDIGYLMHVSIFSYLAAEDRKKENPDSFIVPSIYTFLSMVIGNLKQLEVTLEDTVIFAMDYGKSWRKILDPLYKAQRKELREQKRNEQWWKNQYESFNKFFGLLNICTPWNQVKIFSIEADDIGSVACRYFKDYPVILCSADKDWEILCQYKNIKLFSPKSKKFKYVPNPAKVLLEKIMGADVSDNLTEKPNSEEAFELRKKIVNLLELPIEIENKVIAEFDKMMPKNFVSYKIPYGTLRKRLIKLYGEENE